MSDIYSIFFVWFINPAIASALFIPAFILSLRYNLHMFQLNGYKNNEQISWIRKNAGKQWILYVGAVYSLARVILFFFAIYPIWAPAIIIDLWLLLYVVIYRLYSKQPAKKKLVYTPRVKRLIFTNVLLLAIFLFVIFRAFALIFWTEALLLYASLQFLMPIICNIINKPVESAINRWYINDAKKKLTSVSGIKVIGITGSYGKTSVKFYLNSLLSEKYNVLMTPESFNTPMGVVRTIREHLKPTHEIFLCEMGARYVGDIKELCDIVHPENGIIASIGPQHLETFGGMEQVKNTKFELADAIAGKGKLFLNGDNEYIMEKAGEYDNVVFYHALDSNNSGENNKGYYAKNIRVTRLGTEFTVVTPEGSEEDFSMRLIGKHNVINVVGAIAVAHSFGVEMSDLKIPVRRLEPVAHRLQIIEKGPVTIIDDAYNSNPVGSKAAVETLGMFEGVRILVTPGMVELGEKEEEYNRLFGGYAAENCDYIALVGESHTAPIKEGALAAGFPREKLAVFDKLEEAMAYAYGINEEGHKVILLENDLPDNY